MRYSSKRKHGGGGECSLKCNARALSSHQNSRERPRMQAMIVIINVRRRT